MKISEIVNSLGFELNADELKELNKNARAVLNAINEEIKKSKLKAEVFIGGSFAKATLMKRNKYDIDMFVRFDSIDEKTPEKLKLLLEKASKKLKLEMKVIHGSRDYFAIIQDNLIYEIVPVKKISKPEQCENSTDLSYFHVKYVRDKITKKKLRKEIIVAKAFCRAQGVYGAESWVHGFSGYALECLVINYGSFEKMLRELCKVKEQIFLDKEKKYKNKNDITVEMNESKRKCPIVLVDPTYKLRNVCSALNWETFKVFQESARKFLKNPNLTYFIKKEVNEEKLKKIGKENYLKLIIKTSKQEGDIAGAKLEKFYRFLIEEIGVSYGIKQNFFEFDEKNSAKIYLIVKPKKGLARKGPPVKMEKPAEIFKKMHKDAFVKAGRLYAPIDSMPITHFMKKFIEDNKDKIKSMDIDWIDIN